jgi:nucleoid-associated protein YgaU
MQGSADERDGKLYFHGTVSTQAEANKIWDAIKTVPDWSKDVVADEGGRPGDCRGDAGAAGSTYTVKAGDTLSKIAKKSSGTGTPDADLQRHKDQLTDPDKIKPDRCSRSRNRWRP